MAGFPCVNEFSLLLGSGVIYILLFMTKKQNRAQFTYYYL